MRLLRLVVVLLLLAAAAAFVARLLKPQSVLSDTGPDLGYVGPTPSEGPRVSVADAVPLVPEPRSPSDEPVDVD
ncbi:MAG TPA: hypothetical protein VMI11_10040 [Actinomycetes bacterium]|nr:hypothetical protein [Actinomycetes bacterium]